MAQQHINTGSNPNDGTGDPLRTAFIKTEENFIELFNSSSFVTFPFTGSAQITASEGQTGAALGVTGSIETTGDIYAQTIRVNSLESADGNNKLLLTNNTMDFKFGNVSFFKLDGSSGTLTVNENNADINFQVRGTNETLLFTDAGTNRVGINITNPQTNLHVKGAISSSTYYGIITDEDPEVEGQFFQTSSQGVVGGAAGFTVICISQG